ncbi:MAG: RHS repeat-associated core domain-containing protein, partial [Bdellovibrionales bacterium]|nr:RHS repeat-associated core domain-containing protein [Bdellovibrionales bacterium]
LTDNSVAQEIDYDEYGVVLADSNPGFQPFGFAGGITDQHTNLVRFGARDYMAEVGRWTLMDSSLFTDGLGLYHYVSQDPINYIDISGYNKRFPGPNLTNAGGTIGIGGGRGGGYTVTPRTTRGGGRGVRVNFNDGRVVDITKDRVKEYRPNPNTRSGKERVIFDEGTPRTERWPNDPKKRPPTPEELDFLNRQCPVASGENE